ncbi:MAG: hypothetical protein K8U03_14790 [Planctomycetia bacterium]|nr:hypothetical protein [Planctomycetia bacterium]
MSLQKTSYVRGIAIERFALVNPAFQLAKLCGILPLMLIGNLGDFRDFSQFYAQLGN